VARKLRRVILARDFVFLHFPRSGGTFVRHALAHHAPAEWRVEQLFEHVGPDRIPESHAGLPRFGFIRNPYSWYVSWYHYSRKHGGIEFFERITGGQDLSFDETLRRCFEVPLVQREGPGGCTFVARKMFGRDFAGIEIGRYEDLARDLLRILRAYTAVPDDLAQYIEADQPVYGVAHDHPATYYDDDLRRLVREKDAELFDRFGYDWIAAT